MTAVNIVFDTVCRRRISMKGFTMFRCFVISKLALSFATLQLGCASTPTLGDKMSDRGQTARDLGDQWNDGNAMVRRGGKLAVEADELIEKGKQKRAESLRLLKDGEQMKSASQHSFNGQFGMIAQE